MFQLGGIIEGFVHILEKYLKKLVYFDGVVLPNDFFEKKRTSKNGLQDFLFIYNLDLNFYFIKL